MKLANSNHCTAKEITRRVAASLISSTPLLADEGVRQVFVGLYHSETLIAVMSFRQPEDSVNAQWQLLGIKYLDDEPIKGAPGKLFSLFITQRKVQCIAAFCDTEFCSVNLYLSLGFLLSKNSETGSGTYVWSSAIDGIIYKITNKLNGKIYVGLSKTSDNRRWREHLSSSKFPIDIAIKKYGRENFTYEVIDRAADCYSLAQKERKWIAELKPEYNIKEGGYLIYRAHRSEESRARMREAAKHRPPVSDETRRKMSIARKGRKLSPEHKEALRKANTGRPMSEKCRQRLYEANHSPEATERRRRAATGFKKAPETIEKLRQRNIGKHYYNNGVITVKRYECPEGFVPGILRKDKK